MTNHNTNADDSDSIDAELPTGDAFVDAVVRELQERDQSDVAAWTLENRRDMADLGPREVAREEGVAADPENDDAINHVADTIELGYGDHMQSVEDLENDDD